MRIVGGTLAGRLFSGPPGDATRPTSDRAREAIASAIEARGGFERAVVLDLFAGTGAFSFEALSRGARRAIAVDRNTPCLRAVAKNAHGLGLADRVATLSLDLRGRDAAARVARGAGEPVDLVFADPPWNEPSDPGPLLARLVGSLSEGALVVLVHAAKVPAAPVDGLAEVARYRYGDTALVIYAPAAGVPPGDAPAVPDASRGPGEAP